MDRCRAALVYFKERAYPLNQYVRELVGETTKLEQAGSTRESRNPVAWIPPSKLILSR